MYRIGRVASAALILSIPLASCSNPPEPEQRQEQPGEVFAAGDSAAVQAAEELTMRHLQETQPELLRGVEAVWTKRVLIDERNEAHTRLFQTVAGIPVFGAEAIVHFDRHGNFTSMTDGFLRHIKVDTDARFTDLDATAFAVESQGGWRLVQGQPSAELYILVHKGKPHLAYLVRFTRVAEDGTISIPVVFVDANTGDLVWTYNDLQTALNRMTYTAGNRTALPGTLVRDELSAPVADAVVNQAHDYAGIAYDYYFTTFGRDSFDNAGSTITSSVHVGQDYVNAFWDGTQVAYGDGDNNLSGPLTVLDIVAHELTHAITDYTSDLIYANEPGALNEALSDIFAAAIEAYADNAVTLDTWKIGEDTWTPSTPGDALRYMYDPTRAAGDIDYYPERYVGWEDNGGVHWNSGIANLAFYLMVEGGTHPRGKTTNVVPALDAADPLNSIRKGAQIFYRANTVYMTPQTSYSEARVATINAAADLFGAGSPEVTSVTEAWIAVGVPDVPVYMLLDEQTGISGTDGERFFYQFVTPPGATHIKFETIGNNGDADLYVQFGSPPALSPDCTSGGPTSNEVCEMYPARQGTYHVRIDVYTAFTDLTLRVSWAGVPPEAICDDDVDNDSDGLTDCADSDCAADATCPNTISVGDLDGTAAVISSKAWQSTVTVQVVDIMGMPVSGATVTGTWSQGSVLNRSCTTDAAGLCSVASGNIRLSMSSAAFRVDSVAHPALFYASGGNRDADGDSDGTTIVVARP